MRLLPELLDGRADNIGGCQKNEKVHLCVGGRNRAKASAPQARPGDTKLRLTTIIDYLSERWEEEEAALSRIMNKKFVHRYFQDHGDRMLADIMAKRKMLMESQDEIQRDGSEASLGRVMLGLLVEPYTDRDDFPGRTTRE